MVHQTPINNDYHARWEGIQPKSLVCAMLLLVVVACEVSQPSPPSPRSFTTADLVINPSLLSPEWEAVGMPYPLQPHVLGMHNNLGATLIHLKNSISNLDHIVALFQNSRDAARAYDDHDFTRDTQGKYAGTWETPSGFTYVSPIADQFRVVCVDIKNKDEIGDIGEICAVEARYEEFDSILIYRTSNPARITIDLEILSRAVDAQMGKFLGY
jgi:hypothetical protein